MTSTPVLAAGAATLAAALLAAPAPPASAATAAAVPAATAATAPGPAGVTWAVRPAGPKGPNGRDYFVYSVSPGQTVTDKVTVTNLSNAAQTFGVYATDAFNTADGSFALLTAAQRPTGVGTWIDFGKNAYRVEPGKAVDIPFTLTVPHDATPGDHGGGIVASVTRPETASGGRTVNVDRRVAARVYLRAAGPLRPTLQISELRTGYASEPLGAGRMDVTYTVRNTGNVRVAALARVSAQGPFGVALGEPVERRVPELLPGGSYTFRERVGGVAPAGRLTASVLLSATDPRSGAPVAARPIVRRASLWHVPWAAAVVLAAAAAFVVARRRRAAK
ncbi:WxL protein peptidoglycan domain-containing protein [Actinomadura sp. LOL_016]|uniref:WxL protein peptidoglycan domain-containing protein n=1 Tax=unclassified Actinomadura TaxID=2626254 RepID=UPI003A80A138